VSITGLVFFGAVALLAFLARSPVPLAVYVMAVLVLGAWRNRRGKHLQLYRRVRPVMVLQSVGVLLCVAAAVYSLLSLGNPILSFSWFGYLVSRTGAGGAGGPGLVGGAPAGNVLMGPLSYRWLAVPFVALLYFLLPQLALAEEALFRRGTRTWRQGLLRSVVFGLAHLPMGIPLGAALALSIGGLWFTYQYFRGGVMRSAAYHLAYNLVVMTGIVVLVFVPL
jgi:hypothetical protein